MWTPSNTSIHWPTLLTTPNGIRIQSAMKLTGCMVCICKPWLAAISCPKPSVVLSHGLGVYPHFLGPCRPTLILVIYWIEFNVSCCCWCYLLVGLVCMLCVCVCVLCLRFFPMMHRHQLALCESEKEGSLSEMETPPCWYSLSLSSPTCYLHEMPLVTTAEPSSAVS